MLRPVFCKRYKRPVVLGHDVIRHACRGSTAIAKHNGILMPGMCRCLPDPSGGSKRR